MATVSVTVNSRNSLPTIPPISWKGMNTATKDRLIDTTVKPTSRAPSSAACRRSMPASTCRMEFSMTTMASSTTNPVAMVNAISEKLSRLKSSRYMAPKVPMSETGTTTAGISAARALRRKT